MTQKLFLKNCFDLIILHLNYPKKSKDFVKIINYFLLKISLFKKNTSNNVFFVVILLKFDNSKLFRELNFLCPKIQKIYDFKH